MAAAAIAVVVEQTAAADRRGCPSVRVRQGGGDRIEREDGSVCSYDQKRINDWGGKAYKEEDRVGKRTTAGSPC